MSGVIALSVGLMAGVAVLQSTVLGFVAIAGVQPDLVVVVLAFVANKNGSMVGQLAGLGAGIVLDLMGLAPLGFYALIYALLGAAFGVTRGKVFVDPIFVPVLFAVVAVIIKGLFAAGIAGVFGVTGVVPRVFSTTYLIELGYTAILAPVFFGLLRLVRPLQPERRRGEGL